jgi:hypothetical protein
MWPRVYIAQKRHVVLLLILASCFAFSFAPDCFIGVAMLFEDASARNAEQCMADIHCEGQEEHRREERREGSGAGLNRQNYLRKRCCVGRRGSGSKML